MHPQERKHHARLGESALSYLCNQLRVHKPIMWPFKGAWKPVELAIVDYRPEVFCCEKFQNFKMKDLNMTYSKDF
jgi:hypothetical protein